MANNTTKKISKQQAFANTLSTSNLIALSILVGALSIVLAVVVGRMLVNNMMLNGRVISKKNAANKQIGTNYDNLKTLQPEYNGLGSLRETVSTSLPTSPSMPQLWAMLENLGNSSSVSTKSVSSTATADVAADHGSEVQNLTLSVTVEGSYAAIQTYLQNLELSTRPLRVTNVSLTGTDKTVQASLTIETYYQGEADLKVGSEVVK